jgi:hypothetical protein
VLARLKISTADYADGKRISQIQAAAVCAGWWRYKAKEPRNSAALLAGINLRNSF